MTSEREQVDQDRGHAAPGQASIRLRSGIMTFAEFLRTEVERGLSGPESLTASCGPNFQKGPHPIPPQVAAVERRELNWRAGLDIEPPSLRR
jgi:hypothetical protein